jgi:hypothetical protein
VLDSAPVTTVRYHLQVAKKIEPELEAEHAAALLTQPSWTSPAVNRALAEQFRSPVLRGKAPRPTGGNSPFCGHSPPTFENR